MADEFDPYSNDQGTIDPALINEYYARLRADPLKLGGGQETAAERALRVGIEPGFDLVKAYQAGSRVGPALQRGDTGEAIGSGLLGLGYGVLGAGSLFPGGRGAKVAAEAAAPVKNALRAYHGSPHDFDRFDISKIGTGEGAQAYGHGLYFAEREGTARSYRDILGAPPTKDWMLSDNTGTIPNWAGDQIQLYPHGHKYRDEVIDKLTNIFKGRIEEQYGQWQNQPWMAEDNIRGLQKIVDDLGRVKQGDITLVKPKPVGKMYEVNINADPEHFLDWDKPISQQSEYVKKALDTLITPEERERRKRWKPPDWSDHPKDASYEDVVKGGTLYESSHLVPGEYRDPAEASKRLRDAGIAGIRYLDRGSRAAGAGSSNYAVFDDKTIEVLKKYGLLGLIGGGGAASASKNRKLDDTMSAAEAFE